MTDQRDKANTEPAGGVDELPSTARAGISRRDMIRGASVALPTMLTLNSGTALALSSSARLMPSAQPGQVGDNVVCLDITNLSGPPYPIAKGAFATAVPVQYSYVSLADLSGVKLDQPNDISNAIKQKGLTPLRADQLCLNQAARYVPVTYDAKNGKWDPLRRDNATVIGEMPASANMSVSAFNSMDASKKIKTSFLV
jgi:hypothetical protein